MPLLPGRVVLPLWAVLALVGCHSAPKQKGESPLVPPQMSSDSCVLEIFFVRFPFGNPQINGHLWQEVDEQHFPALLRQRLARNGFRVGLLSGQLPIALSELLELSDKPPPSGNANHAKVIEMDCPPRVVRRRLQIRSGQRGEIVASRIYDQLSVLLCEQGQLGGETYCQAQAMLAVKTFPQDDGRVRLELIPELHHDQTRQRWVGNQGMFRLEAGRPRRVFDNMGVSAVLSPGSMLILSSLPDRPGSLGHHFFTEDDGQLEQKLLVVRLSQTQHDELFTPP